MEDNKIKISACILSKNDEQFIKDCVLQLCPYVDEILVLDANDDDTSINILRSIPEIQEKLFIKQKKGYSEDFAKDRNELQSDASGDYILHIDCDERLDVKFLSKMKDIIKSYLENDTLPILFRLPRINQPDNINFPDYQIRLINKKYSYWNGKVHEVPEIINLPKDTNIINLITLDYPIIHLNKEKKEIQKRWNSLFIKNYVSRLSFLAIFKDSDKYIKDILGCINDIYQNNNNQYRRLNINFSFLDRNSNDEIFKILEKYCKEGAILNIQLRRFKIDKQYKNRKVGDISYIRMSTNSTNYLLEQIPLSYNNDDYILVMSGDVIFSEDLVHELIIDLDNYNADIIAPMIYIGNYKDFDHSQFCDAISFIPLDQKSFGSNTPYPLDIDIDKSKKIDKYKIGTFYIMRNEVAKNIKYTGDSNLEHIEFCNNAKSKGYKIYIDPRLSVFHIFDLKTNN